MSRKKSSITRSQNQGIALVTVMFVVTIVSILGIILSAVSISERRATTNTRLLNEAVQIADGVSEHGRMTIIETFENSPYNINTFMKLAAQDGIPQLKGVHDVTIGGITGKWEVKDVAPAGSNYGWIDIAATANLDGGASQTVIRRVGFGDSSTFNLAMLSETTNCMFCHLQVNGDVGNLVFMRPGWGKEGGAGKGSGHTSNINGNVYAAREVTKDKKSGVSGQQLNGTLVSGTIETNSKNPALPDDIDGDGVPDFPPIKRDVAKTNAVGTIKGAALAYGVPLGGKVSGDPTTFSSNLSGVNKSYDGNLILVGTDANPINLDGDIWVEGDVIIKGVVTGQGAIYTGRNVYFAGDVTLKDPPHKITDTACKSLSVPPGSTLNDECAKKSVAEGKDALRIGARANVVIGDYTEYNADGSKQSYAGLQSSDFYRAQFGFNGNWKRYYDKKTGDELTCNSGTCKNVENEVITDRVGVKAKDAYDYTFRPGSVESNGSFKSWLSDGQYSKILGEEEMSRFIWRQKIDKNQSQSDFIKELEKTGLTNKVAKQIAAMREGKGELEDENGKKKKESGTVFATDKWGGKIEIKMPDMWDGNKKKFKSGTLKIRHLDETKFETQVNQVDAFLYANRRIAGKVNEQALSVLGGMVAKELGVLSPGRSNHIDNKECEDPKSKYYVDGAAGCTMTVNYDYRLKNGGYGFNLVSGQVGQTLSWHVSEDYGDRVK